MTIVGDPPVIDGERLAQFVAEAHAQLEELVARSDLFPAELQPAIAVAWREFNETFDLAAAQDKARAIEPTAAIAAGLFGAQLDLKMVVVDHWKQKLADRFRFPVLRKLFGAIDTVLGSLFVATGIDHALEEIKDILLNSVDDDAQE